VVAFPLVYEDDDVSLCESTANGLKLFLVAPSTVRWDDSNDEHFSIETESEGDDDDDDDDDSSISSVSISNVPARNPSSLAEIDAETKPVFSNE
jgi:hypothetical protein